MNNQPEITSTKTVAKNLVSMLRQEAEKNKVFNSVCHVFAMRERTRQQVTIQSLQITMEKEKFTFTKPQLEGVLKFMATLGIGTLEYDRHGSVRALKNIRVTLQSIGLAALSRKESLDKFQAAPVFKSLVIDMEKPKVAAAAPLIGDQRFTASLSVNIYGKTLIFELPKGVSMQELSNILANIYADKAEKKAAKDGAL